MKCPECKIEMEDHGSIVIVGEFMDKYYCLEQCPKCKHAQITNPY